MRLQPKPFHQVKEGIKTIERRLYDEKRRLLSVGDMIEFSNASNEAEKVTVEIIGLFPFKSFQELSENFAPETYGMEIDDPSTHTSQYYSKEDEEKWGVIAIMMKSA